ncbi:MAG: hypothetical protein K9M45_00685 [Kiritimatiellales bacterium]|nr:hypothetical protein [Kiritimatiellales bacterium]
MTEDTHNAATAEIPDRQLLKKAIKPLSTNERVWLFILSIYTAVFCISTFVYWDNLTLKIVGSFAAAAGLFLFAASFFNTESPETSHSRHPINTFIINTVIIIAVLLLIRFAGGVVRSTLLGGVIIYGGLLAALVVFRKALLQIVSTALAVVFLVYTLSHWTDIVIGNTSFKDAVRHCSGVMIRIGPIQELKDLVVTGSYMGYLSKVEYRNPFINVRASRIVSGTRDDELLKTQRLLAYVSNEIEYISDPGDGLEYPKDPLMTLDARAGDCEDQTVLLCSMLETVGVKSYIVFTRTHVFALVQFAEPPDGMDAVPFLYIDQQPCYALDPSTPGAVIGDCSATAGDVRRIFDIRERRPVKFSIGNRF